MKKNKNNSTVIQYKNLPEDEKQKFVEYRKKVMKWETVVLKFKITVITVFWKD